MVRSGEFASEVVLTRIGAKKLATGLFRPPGGIGGVGTEMATLSREPH